MLADALRSLRPGWGYTFAAFEPIEERWFAAQLFDACTLRDFGALVTALRSNP
jgi:hypothetical protein